MSDWVTLKENCNYELSVNSHEIRNCKSKKVIKPWIDSKGYYNVTLYENGKAKKYKYHRILYNNLVETLKSTDMIDHINCNRLDNRLENLRIATRSENSINSKRTTDFMQIDEKTQESLTVLDLTNEVFFYSKLKIFVRKIYKNKFRILPINYQSQFYQIIQYTTNHKNYWINVAPYLYPELANNLNLILIHSDGIYFCETSRKFYKLYRKTNMFKELKQRYNSKNSILISYRFEGKTKHMNVYSYLYKNYEIKQS